MDIKDTLENALVGPGSVSIQKYLPNGTLDPNKIIVGYTKEGIDFKATFEEYVLSSDAVYCPVDVKTSGISGKGSAIVQDVSPAMLNAFLGSNLITDPDDETKKRVEFFPEHVENSAFSALVKFIPKSQFAGDRVVLLTRCSVRVAELDLSHKKSAQQLFSISITLLQPPENQPIFKIGSETAAPASVPIVQTQAATSIASDAAGLNASVTPSGITGVFFDWGKTAAALVNSSIAVQSPLSGTDPVAVSAAIGILEPETDYFFRVRAVGPGGTTTGNILSFTSGS